jgi:hypothetical protein
MALIRRGTTASGPLLWTVPQTIAPVSLPVKGDPPPVSAVQPVPRILSFGGYCFNGQHMGLKSNCELRVVQGASVQFVYQGSTEIYSYVAGTPDGNLASLEAAIDAAKGFGLPVIAYWPRSLQSGPLPKGADLVGVEAYMQEPTLTAWEHRVRASLAKCPKSVLIAQCYTSNASLTKDLRSLVAPYSDLLNDVPNIKACLLFSGAGRATGLQDHPEVKPYWSVIANSVKTPALPTPPDPPDPPDPEPEPPVPFPTDAEFTDFTAKLEAKYQNPPMSRPTGPTFVDPLGRGRWTYDYALHRQAGDTHDQAWAKVDHAINVIIGNP